MTKPTEEEFLQSKDIWHHPLISNRMNTKAYELSELLEEHANNKAEEMAIGFGKWLTNSGNIKSHLIENSFEEYKQSLK